MQVTFTWVGVQSDELLEDGLIRGVSNRLSHESVLAHRILTARFEVDRRAYDLQHPSNGLDIDSRYW